MTTWKLTSMNASMLPMLLSPRNNEILRLGTDPQAEAERFLAFVCIAGALICSAATPTAHPLLVCRRPARSDRKLAC
ncbi:hypothetical protein U9R90_04200 [Streptomyces sp. E11-3]|uniref:hypothetical protein n=1 Tax=Streptomyces sp. E11-3 TaxID=3110112 RepID=UPI00397F5189